MLIRLDKMISSTGEYSRSEAKALIKRGLVTVDGRAASSGDVKIDAEKSEIRIKGEPFVYAEHHYIMMNKPAGVLSATEDRGDKTVLDLLEPRYRRLGLFPAGRLDKDTEGLLLLTDDGDFCHNVISPAKKVTKVYFAEIIGQLDQSAVTGFREGVTLDDGYRCRPADLVILEGKDRPSCLVSVEEGKFHQVKRMLKAFDCQVIYLKRLKIGGLSLDEGLKPGEYRELTADEAKSALS